MRATFLGLMAAGLSLCVVGHANAGFSNRGQGLEVGNFGRQGHDGWRHHHQFPFPYGFAVPVVGPTLIGPAPAPTNFGLAAFDIQIIVAPEYVPAAPVARRSHSGPRIIEIGAQPKGPMPVVIYGAGRGALAN